LVCTPRDVAREKVNGEPGWTHRSGTAWVTTKVGGSVVVGHRTRL